MTSVYDGFVSRHINRRLSEPLTRLLAKTRFTPNQATWGAFGVAVLASIGFIMGQNVVGGILIQLSSVADGVDGALARLKGMTSFFGGLLDSVLDRYADALILLGMTLWSLSHESYAGIWLAGFFAVVGTMLVSYTRARIGSEHSSIFDRGFASLASRDIRLFLLMLGAVVGQVYFCLLVIAGLTNIIVLYRIIYSYRRFGGKVKASRVALATHESEKEDTVSVPH